MLTSRIVARAIVSLLLAGDARSATAQAPPTAPSTAPLASGQAVFPVFEGWYRNPDGSYSLSFGYFNRNTKEVVDVPLGANNTIGPDIASQPQPTHFEPRRHWGVFVVTVPATFGKKQTVTWSLTVRGETYAIPGSLRGEWQIDALEGEVGSGNTPPVLKFAANGPSGSGPGGITSDVHAATVGRSLTVTVWATDDGRSPAVTDEARKKAPPHTTLTWFVHQGPAAAVFGRPTAKVPAAGGSASTTVTFATPGSYVLRVRANDQSGVASAGHAQCCWSNGYVRVMVTR